MKGFWHFPALGVTVAFLTVLFGQKWLLALFVIWLLYLVYYNRLGKLTLLISLAFAMSASIYIPQLEKPQSSSETYPMNESNFTGEITSPIETSDSRTAFELSDDRSDHTFLVVHFNDAKNIGKQLKSGATCTIRGDPEIPPSNKNPGQFDYQRYLLTQDIRYQVVLDSPQDISCTGASMMNTVYELRSDLIKYVDSKVSSDTASWLNALVFGDDSGLDEEMTERFQRWSLSHLMAISGLHVGIVVALIYFLLVRLNLLTKEKAHWIVIFFLPLYVFLAGGEPSVLRAAFMVVLFLLANKWKWTLSVTDVLSIVFLLLVLFDPYMLYYVGFQFSFCVTFGLLLSRSWLAQTTSSFFTVLNISFVSQMMILPLQIAYFHTFHPLSIPLNLIVVPYFTLFVIPFMFGILLVAPVSQWLVSYADQLFISIHDMFLSSVEWIDQTLYIPWVIGSFPLAGALVYYTLFVIFMKKVTLNQLWQAFKYGCFITALIMLLMLRPYFSPAGHFTMLNIGQGGAMVIELPYRQGVIVVDAGAELSFGDDAASDNEYKQIIRPYLYSRGITQVDAVFISHDHMDHMGSVKFMADELTVGSVIVSDYFVFSKQLAKALERNETEVIRASTDDVMTVGKQTFQVLAPHTDKNDKDQNSLVLYTQMGGEEWLFTGDIGKETERQLAGDYPGLNPSVLKVAHHGSNTSTDPGFIEQLEPAYGLISAGENNQYGHPTPSVIKTLDEAGVTILRTDQKGAIQFHFTGSKGTFSVFKP
ncbi:DNA internalization-related competence protein ComEC/Rec2 [Barrientosiimonas marina]|uniref:DNA internalization-related competence protein ComEC/Rec2 n=1 Tax=Lentibacillus kimchii TaxID=1542911 RepID=A0ABW2UZM8_9BACI